MSAKNILETNSAPPDTLCHLAVPAETSVVSAVTPEIINMTIYKYRCPRTALPCATATHPNNCPFSQDNDAGVIGGVPIFSVPTRLFPSLN